jgi:hypothetical protein
MVIKVDEVGGACRMHGRYEYNILLEKPEWERPLEET